MLNSCEEVIEDLICLTDNDYIYHTVMLDALEGSVSTGREVIMLRGNNNIHVSLHPSDWALAIAKCKRYFKDESDLGLKKRLSQLESKIRCYLENSHYQQYSQ